TPFYGSFYHDDSAKTYSYSDESGIEWVFYDNDTSHSAELRGQLKDYSSSYGESAQLVYDSNDELESATWSDGGESYYYTFYDTLAHIGRLKQVEVDGGDGPRRRVNYQYYADGASGGEANDLKLVTIEEYDEFYTIYLVV